MAVEFIAPFCVLLFALASSQAKPKNYTKGQCKLLPIGKRFASEFRLKASEKVVRTVYLNLKIGSNTYHPLKLKDDDRILPERWVWANSISEPMLSFSYEYDILSLGLLNYQVRSVDVHLEDQPSGCLANLNSSRQNKVVGRALLNVTQHNHAGLLHGTDVVCVARKDQNMLNEVLFPNVLMGYFYQIIFPTILIDITYDCCDKGEQGSFEESASIECELKVQNSVLSTAFNYGLNILTMILFLFCPAFLLLLPDFLNLKEELQKEKQRKRLQQQDNQALSQITRYRSHGITDPVLLNLDSSSRSTGADSDLVPIGSIGENEINRNQSEPIRQRLIYLDEPSPVSFSYFFGNYNTKEFSELFPFHVKLAFLCYCVVPIFVYIELGLNYIIERKFLEEMSKKQREMLSFSLFTYIYNIRNLPFRAIFIIVTPLIMILCSSPKDFLFVDDGLQKIPCFICWESTSSDGEDMLKHFEKLQASIYYAASFLIKIHRNGIETSIKSCTHCCLKKIRYPYKRLKTLVILLWVLPCNVVLFTFFGVFLGGLYLSMFLGWLVLLTLWYSPSLSLMLVMQLRKAFQIMNMTLSLQRMPLGSVFSVIFIFPFQLGVGFLYGVGSFVGSLSCRFIVRMVGFIILGLVLNAKIVGPFLTFFLVALTNIYLCYYNLQMRYQDVKQMILQKWQTSADDKQSEQGAIPEDLFWHICSATSDSKHKVLRGPPIGSFNPAIPTKIFPQSRNPDGFYQLIPIPATFFLSPLPQRKPESLLSGSTLLLSKAKH